MRRIIITGPGALVGEKLQEALDDLTEDGRGYVQAEGVEGSTLQPNVEVEFAALEEEVDGEEGLSVHIEDVPDN